MVLIPGGYQVTQVRLLYAGHTYLVNENQKKLAALSRCPGVELAVVVPDSWREPVLERLVPHIDPLATFSVHPTRVIFSGNEMRYFYLSRDLLVRRFRPDFIVVENGAGAFVYTQFLLYRHLFAPRAKVVFFTWWNLPYGQEPSGRG